MMSMFNDQISNDLLRSLPPEDLAQAKPLLRSVRLVPGQVLYEVGEEAERVYFPEAGLISLVTKMANGHDVQNTSRGRDGGVAYTEAVGSGVVHSRALVQIGGRAWVMRASDFRALYNDSGSLRALILRRLEFLLAEARQSIACSALHPAEGRFARMLLECRQHTGELRFPLTQDFMADMVGVGRTTITHSASRLKALGLIRYTRGTVTLKDVAALERHTCECYSAIASMRRAILGDGHRPFDQEPVSANSEPAFARFVGSPSI